MSIGNALRLSDGRIIKGTLSGVLYFNSDSLATKKSIYNIYTKITAIEKSGEELTMILQDTIRFNKRPESIKMYASVLDFQRVSHIVYAYRISNVDSQWRYTSDISQMELPKLPCGYSTLEIEATNGDGVWSGNKRTIVFYMPYNWNKIIAVTVLCLLISCVVYISLYKYHGMKIKLSKVLKRSSVFNDIPTKEENAENFKKDIREMIIANLSNSDFSIDGLAQEIGLSRSVLSTKIKDNFDMTPIELINTIRIQAARELLLNSDMNISEIAYKTGFNDPKYFSRAYKKQTGKSPTQERQQV
jgi:AraC-like DNA-binding protein